MNETQPWVPLEGPDLLRGVRDILIANPERHNNRLWVGNVYLDLESDIKERRKVPVDQIREHMFQPIPANPQDTGAEVPPCGTTGCAIGWGGILSAPAGSYVTNGRIYLPDGSSHWLMDWVPPRMGLNPGDASSVFSPNRTTQQIIDIMDARIADPEADIRAIVYPALG
jgi:hypothetical protein